MTDIKTGEPLTLEQQCENQRKEAFETLCKAKREKKAVPATVRVASLGRSEPGEHLVADYQGIRIVIPREELDDQIVLRNLMGFVGRTVYVIIKTVNPEEMSAIGSRADAQRLMRPVIMQRLTEEKRSYKAAVISVMKYGVMVDIKGVVGLLLNRDFADDVTRAGDVLKVGDVISVHLKFISVKNTLHFEADTKYCSPNALRPDEIETNQVVLGIVSRVVNTPNGLGYFVNIAKGVDALASAETGSGISTDDRVQMKVLKVVRPDNSPLRVRGVIKAVI